MRANVNSDHQACLSVYLNDKKQTDCIEGDEDAGYVWVCYRNATGKVVPSFDAEPGALIHGDVQVIKLHGKVRFDVDAEDAKYYGLTVEEFKRVIDESFVPIQPKQI